MTGIFQDVNTIVLLFERAVTAIPTIQHIDTTCTLFDQLMLREIENAV